MEGQTGLNLMCDLGGGTGLQLMYDYVIYLASGGDDDARNDFFHQVQAMPVLSFKLNLYYLGT